MSRNLECSFTDLVMKKEREVARKILKNVCNMSGYEYCLVLTSKDDPHEEDYIYSSMSELETHVEPKDSKEFGKRWTETISKEFDVKKQTKKETSK